MIANNPSKDFIVGANDTLTILFNRGTDAGYMANGILGKGEVDQLFEFSSKLADDYSGLWNYEGSNITITIKRNNDLVFNFPMNAFTVKMKRTLMLSPAFKSSIGLNFTGLSGSFTDGKNHWHMFIKVIVLQLLR
jgi:hypothetical protein